jgi:hypothetical protein
MTGTAEILLFGTGSFAARILFDIAATAERRVTVVVAGRKAERLAWLRTAGQARAAIFERPVRIGTRIAGISNADAAAEIIAAVKPKVIVQAASEQGGAVISTRGNVWSRLVADSGLSATAVFQALLSSRVARGLADTAHRAFFINCCYADVVNSLIAALGLPITTGVGNVSILSNAFAGELGPQQGHRLKLLAHYQTIGLFRRPPGERTGPLPRVWIDDAEIDDVCSRFQNVQLTPEPVIDISGASAVPMILAMAAGLSWTGHAPGPLGLPGGYPVKLTGGQLELNLPVSVTRDEAIRWNAGFEERNGLIVENDGCARYTGALRDKLAAHSTSLAGGFHVRDLETVFSEMVQLRGRLLERPAQ